MRRFIVSIVKIAVIILLISITLPTITDSIAPLYGSSQQSGNVELKPRWVVNPDNPLYALQRGIEGLQLGFSGRNQVKAHLLLRFSQERASEAAAMLNKKETALAIRSVSDLVDNLQTLEAMRDYLPSSSQDDVDSVILNIKTNSASTVAQIIHNSTGTAQVSQNSGESDLENILHYIQADQEYQAAIKHLESSNIKSVQ